MPIIINSFNSIQTETVYPSRNSISRINLTIFKESGLANISPMLLKGTKSSTFREKITYFNINPNITLRDGLVDNTLPSATKKIEYYFLAKHKTNSTYIQWIQVDNDVPDATLAGVPTLSVYFDPDVLFTKEIVE